MARNFIKANTEYINLPDISSGEYGTVYTTFCWFKNAGDGSIDEVLFSDRENGANAYHQLWLSTTPIKLQGFVSGDTTQAVEINSTTVTGSVWHSAALVRDGNSLEVFLDGVIGPGSSESYGAISTPTAALKIGIQGVPSQFQPMDGDIAHCCVWDVALNQSEMTALSKGVSPNLIRPGNILRYYPLWGLTNEADVSGSGDVGTLINTPAVATTNPPVGRLVTPKIFAPATPNTLDPYNPPIDPVVDFAMEFLVI